MKARPGQCADLDTGELREHRCCQPVLHPGGHTQVHQAAHSGKTIHFVKFYKKSWLKCDFSGLQGGAGGQQGGARHKHPDQEQRDRGQSHGVHVWLVEQVDRE